MRILLTGGSGYIGRQLAAILCAQGNETVTLGRRPCPVPGVENLLLPELETAHIAKAIAGRSFDVLFHLAAAGVHPAERNAALLQRINAELPATLIRLAADCGVGVAVVAGSNAEYRAPQQRSSLAEDAPLEDAKLYGRSKAAGGIAALRQGERSGVPTAVLRIFNVYGPGEAPHRLFSTLAHSLRAGEAVPLSSGEQLRDFIHIADVCEGVLAAAAALHEGRMRAGAYNLCTGNGRSVADFARAAAAALGAEPTLLRFGEIPWRPDDVPYLIGDPQRLQAACGWQARLSLEAGITAALQVPAYG